MRPDRDYHRLAEIESRLKVESIIRIEDALWLFELAASDPVAWIERRLTSDVALARLDSLERERAARSALTETECVECEITGKYGSHCSNIQIDHKGRIFATSTSPNGEACCVIFNEYSVGRESVERLRALCDYWLSIAP